MKVIYNLYLIKFLLMVNFINHVLLLLDDNYFINYLQY